MSLPHENQAVLTVGPDLKDAQAEGYTWYPNRFIAPLEQNEPYLSGALAVVDDISRQVQGHGIPSERIFMGSPREHVSRPNTSSGTRSGLARFVF